MSGLALGKVLSSLFLRRALIGIAALGLAASHVYMWHKGQQDCYRDRIEEAAGNTARDSIDNTRRAEATASSTAKLERDNESLRAQLKKAIQQSGTDDVSCSLSDDELRIIQQIQKSTEPGDSMPRDSTK